MNEPERRWLYMANEDLRTAELTWREGIYAQTCFHAQQCAEKALKALLVAQTSRAAPRTHFIVELLLAPPTTPFWERRAPARPPIAAPRPSAAKRPSDLTLRQSPCILCLVDHQGGP